MPKLIDSIINRARNCNKKIVLPEGEEPRIQRAATAIVKNDVAELILLGDEEKIRHFMSEEELIGIEIINPKTSKLSKGFVEKFYQLRKEKGMTLEKAEEIIHNNNYYFGAMLVKEGMADGMVGGAVHTTGELLRPALQIIKTAKDINTVSSVFLLGFENTFFKDSEVLVFGDCAVNINPNAEQLADIAIASAASAQRLANITEPKVAMLSFSTKGSAKDDSVEKVVKATQIAKEKMPNLLIDGELQVDAALVPAVQRLKAPGSSIAGAANVLIFPDLDAGNIGYKLAQRLAGAIAIGPICQGFAKPVNDLSRGCDEDDIIAVVAITVLQC